MNIVLPAGERCDRIGQSTGKTKRTIQNTDPLLQQGLSGHPLHILPCSQLWQGTAEGSIHRQRSSELQHRAMLVPRETGPGAEGQIPPVRSAVPLTSTKELEEPPGSGRSSTFWGLGFATTHLSLTLSICMLLPILFFSRVGLSSLSSHEGLEKTWARPCRQHITVFLLGTGDGEVWTRRRMGKHRRAAGGCPIPPKSRWKDLCPG